MAPHARVGVGVCQRAVARRQEQWLYLADAPTTRLILRRSDFEIVASSPAAHGRKAGQFGGSGIARAPGNLYVERLTGSACRSS